MWILAISLIVLCAFFLRSAGSETGNRFAVVVDRWCTAAFVISMCLCGVIWITVLSHPGSDAANSGIMQILIFSMIGGPGLLAFLVGKSVRFIAG